MLDVIDYSPAATGMTYYDNNNPAGLLIDGTPDGFTSGSLGWQLVTGSQGSVTMVPQFSTDVPGFVATSTYEDNVTPAGVQCTGDAFAYGTSGVEITGSSGLPNTDPSNGPYSTLTATRFIYYDAPGLSVADALQRQAWALNPLAAFTSPWP